MTLLASDYTCLLQEGHIYVYVSGHDYDNAKSPVCFIIAYVLNNVSMYKAVHKDTFEENNNLQDNAVRIETNTDTSNWNTLTMCRD